MRRGATSFSLLGGILALAILGIVYGLWSKTLTIEGVADIGFTNADFVAASTNDPPGTIDPGYEKDVASCIAQVADDERVTLVINGAFPSYTCTFTTTIKNMGTLPERREALEFDVPPVLTVIELTDLTGVVLDPGESDVEAFTVHLEQEAQQGASYVFNIRKPFSLFTACTPGFWKNWDSHNAFTQAQIEGWLAEIDATSAWLGPTTMGGMEAIFVAATGQGATPQSRFLAQYLATRLCERSGILNLTDKHDATGKDPSNYLSLANPAAATLGEIIATIESKFSAAPPPPTNTQFNIMKDVCDALNNLDI